MPYETWPQIFRQKDLGPAETSMCWGVQCDDGWAGLVGALCEVTTAHAYTGAHPVLAATTVKEKFASLRVHFEQRCEFCDGARWLVDAYSTRVCEVTGRPGVRYTAQGGGVKTDARAGHRRAAWIRGRSASAAASPREQRGACGLVWHRGFAHRDHDELRVRGSA